MRIWVNLVFDIVAAASVIYLVVSLAKVLWVGLDSTLDALDSNGNPATLLLFMGSVLVLANWLSGWLSGRR